MSQSDNLALRDIGLNADADFKSPLKRVSYQPGMLLGLESTHAEQEYFRRHLNRHNYWLHGSGTVVGLRVATQGADTGDDTTHTRVQLHISPGVGLDGLGREITVYEPYCIDLGAWLSTQFADNERWDALIRDGYEQVDGNDLLQLKVTMRYQDNPSGLQPVMATEINAGTDPVQPSRILDGVLFELLAERPKDALSGTHPFAAHNGLPEWNDALKNKLSTAEQQHIDNASGAEQAQLQLAARLLYNLADDNEALATRANLSAAELARTLLARVTIKLTASRELIINPRRISVDNLVRPFVFKG